MALHRDTAEERLARIEKMLEELTGATKRLEAFTEAARQRAREQDRVAAEQAGRDVKRLTAKIRKRKPR
jgi:hypothetical protein